VQPQHFARKARLSVPQAANPGRRAGVDPPGEPLVADEPWLSAATARPRRICTCPAARQDDIALLALHRRA
jgi:hypothetical protein